MVHGMAKFPFVNNNSFQFGFANVSRQADQTKMTEKRGKTQSKEGGTKFFASSFAMDKFSSVNIDSFQFGRITTAVHFSFSKIRFLKLLLILVLK